MTPSNGLESPPSPSTTSGLPSRPSQLSLQRLGSSSGFIESPHLSSRLSGEFGSERALNNGNMQAELLQRWLKIFILYAFLFMGSIFTYIGMVIWAAVENIKHDEDDPEKVVKECQPKYYLWMDVFWWLVIIQSFVLPYLQKMLGKTPALTDAATGNVIAPANDPPNSKRLKALFQVTMWIWQIVGLVWSSSEDGDKCKAANHNLYMSWHLLNVFALICNTFIILGLGFAGALLVRLSRAGLLTDESNAAPTDTIDQLEKISTSDALEEGNCCSICLEEFNDDDMEAGSERGTPVKTPCGHSFHKNCLAQWFKCAKTCPACRADVPSLLASGSGSSSNIV